MDRRSFLAVGAIASASVRGSAAPFVAPRDPQCVAYSADGKRIALGYSGLSNGESPPRPHPDVKKTGCVQIHDAVSGKRLRRFETFGDLLTLAFSPDGEHLAASRLFTGGDGVVHDDVQVWLPAEGRAVRKFERARGFSWTDDSRGLVIVGRTRCAEFSLFETERVRVMEGLARADWVGRLDRERLLGIVPLRNEPTNSALRIVSFAEGTVLAESPPLAEPCYRAAIAADGSLAALGFSGGRIVIYDTRTLASLGTWNLGTRGIAHPFFSPDGKVLAGADQTTGDTAFLALESRREIARYTFEKGGFRPYTTRDEADRRRPEADPTRFTFHPEGQAYLAGCYGGIVRRIDDGRDILRLSD